MNEAGQWLGAWLIVIVVAIMLVQSCAKWLGQGACLLWFVACIGFLTRNACNGINRHPHQRRNNQKWKQLIEHSDTCLS